MKLEKILYRTPEMTEEKLRELIKKHKWFLDSGIVKRLREIHKFNDEKVPQIILNEWDLIQSKQSFLSKSQRDKICALVSVCLVEMAKGNEQVVSQT